MSIHPLYFEYDRLIEEDLAYFSTVSSLEQANIYIDEFMGICSHNLSYRNKIKGFHIAFSIKDPLRKQTATPNLKIKKTTLKMTSEELKGRVAERKLMRKETQMLKEEEEKKKY